MSDPPPLSEVPDPSPQSSDNMNSNLMTMFSSGMEAILQKIADNMVTSRSTSSTQTKLVSFDPDTPGSDVVNWCTLTEMIVEKRQLEGVELILALTHSLKGRAALCLTKVQPDKITWPAIKEIMISQFSKPMMMQDHFDEIIKFQIESKEGPAEAGMRLWQLMEKIPEANLPEKVITGFAISILSQCDDKIRRELNSVVINEKNQLFRTLRGFTLKRKIEESSTSESDPKKFRVASAFRGNCHFCGRVGHRGHECKDKQRGITKNFNFAAKMDQSKPAVKCYICNDPGHVATSCPKRWTKKDDSTPSQNPSTKQVNLCSRAARGVLQISDTQLPFIFDSGSECSLLKQRYSNIIIGERFHEQVILKGLGSNNVISSLQIKCSTMVQNLEFDVKYHVLPDEYLSEDVLLGRDILDEGISVNITGDRLIFASLKTSNVCTKLEKMFDIQSIETDLIGREKEHLMRILTKYSMNFIQKLPTSRISTGELKIDLIDPNKTVHRRPYRLSPSELEIVESKCQELLESNIIRNSSSPYASPILLVKKKDGSDRMCVDYRELNSNTRPDSYPLPLISDQIDKLHGAHYFSIIDMASGFHQIRVHEDSIEKTAFVIPSAQYEWLTMPFGLRNAPQVFQRAINAALKPLHDNRILVYMDDVLSASETVEEGLIRLDKLLDTLSKAGFSFNFKKCSFMKKKIEYLGFVISAGEIRPNPRKIEALQNVPAPTTVTQVRQFIGLATYFRQFIPNFSKIMKPLYPLTAIGKGKIIWTAEHDKIHKEIVGLLVTKPVLKIFEPSLPIELHTDASNDGYGAVLIQKKNNLPHVVAYFSHKTSEAESRYHSYELETLAVVKSVEHFRHYLYGRKFTVFTDCNALKSSHSKKDLTPRVHRWWAILQSYDFDICYKEGKNMAHADFFSRNPIENEVNISHAPNQTKIVKIVNLSELDKGWLTVEQLRDPEISDIISKLRSNDLPTDILHTYDIRQGILYRKIERRMTTKWLPILPRSLIWSLVNHVHNEIKHLGYEKTLDKLYDLYWFENMSKYVKRFVDSCVICKASKGPSGAQQVRLHPIPKLAIPWHTIHLDLTGKLSGKSDRKEYCSVIIDAFTKFVLLEHTLTLNSLDAVKAVKKAVHFFGAPKRIIADRGRSYDNSDFKNFCKDNNIELHLIATGSSRANGQVERVMRTLKSLLTIVECDTNNLWQDHLGDIQLALNSTRCRVTGFTPIELMFGIQANSLGLSRLSVSPHDTERLDLNTARSKASSSIQKQAQSDTVRFNRGKAKVCPFSLGDFVFVKSEERHQTKLDRKYKGPFKITAVLNNDRYEMRHINGTNRIYKFSHENLRKVPHGQLGLIETSENYSDDDDVTARDNDDDDNTVIVHETHKKNQNASSIPENSDTMSVNSDTMTASSRTLTATSDYVEQGYSRTRSIDSIEPESTNIVTSAVVHREDEM